MICREAQNRLHPNLKPGLVRLPMTVLQQCGSTKPYPRCAKGYSDEGKPNGRPPNYPSVAERLNAQREGLPKNPPTSIGSTP